MAAAIERLDNLRLVLIETPAKPTLVMSDIKQAAEAVRRHPRRPLLAIDNTLLGRTFSIR